MKETREKLIKEQMNPITREEMKRLVLIDMRTNILKNIATNEVFLEISKINRDKKNKWGTNAEIDIVKQIRDFEGLILKQEEELVYIESQINELAGTKN